MERKINAEIMKQKNRKEILRIIRKEPCSRIELAKRTGLTRAAISFICEELILDGLLIEGEKQASGGGRPATVIRLNPEYGVFGGVHFSRNEYAVGVCDFDGVTVKERRGRVDAKDATNTIEKIKRDLKGLLDGEKRLLGIGITAPGPLSRKDGRLGDIPNFATWQGFEIVKSFENEFGCKCVLDNFSNALAYAESLNNPDCKNRYLELIIDSGFGSAVAVVENGVRCLECELGHTVVNMKGERCDCGNIGCAELYVNERKFTGGKSAQKDFYTALASVVVSAVNTFQVDQVVFAGCVTKAFDEFSVRLRTELEKRNKASVQIIATALDGKEVSVASNLFIDENY